MSLINSTYFVKDIAIPNIDEIENTLNGEIERYETEILKKLLGYTLWKEFTDALAAGDPIAQKWLDLRDGAEFSFQYEGHTINTKWEGLINADKRSLISYYVYYQHRYTALSTTTSINDVVGIPENADKVNDVRKMAKAWKEMLKLYGDLNFIYWKSPILLPFDKYSSTYEFYDDQPSAYNFINANRSDYDNWVFEPLERINEFGI